MTLALPVLRLVVWLLLLSAVFIPLERLFPERPAPVLRKGWRVDLGYFFLNGLLPAVLLSLPLGFVGWAAQRLLPDVYTQVLAGMPLWLQIVVALVVGEIGFYWGHRWSHELPVLWRFHSIHHSAEQIDFLVNTRAHPIDMVFTQFCGLGPLYALGLATLVGSDAGLTPLFVVVVGRSWGFFIHANLKWRFGPLEHLVSTPAFHHWHHTMADHKDRNYASTLPWLDRMFGTHYLPRQSWPAEYGIETPMPDGLASQLAEPFAGRGSA